MCDLRNLSRSIPIPKRLRSVQWYRVFPSRLRTPLCLYAGSSRVPLPMFYACIFRLASSGSDMESCDFSPAPTVLSLCSSTSALLFRILKYVCHPMATKPAKILLYCGSIYVKLNAVTAGHNLQLLMKEVGTVLRIRSQTSGRESPERKDCIPKK